MQSSKQQLIGYLFGAKKIYRVYMNQYDAMALMLKQKNFKDAPITTININNPDEEGPSFDDMNKMHNKTCVLHITNSKLHNKASYNAGLSTIEDMYFYFKKLKEYDLTKDQETEIRDFIMVLTAKTVASFRENMTKIRAASNSADFSVEEFFKVNGDIIKKLAVEKSEELNALSGANKSQEEIISEINSNAKIFSATGVLQREITKENLVEKSDSYIDFLINMSKETKREK